MSRTGSAPNRSLTLTEELERLEQSITLTLQEIDHNFSKAHRIVTSAILPIVEQYAEHSQNVWEGSKFWKHFFEASANVSLSGYEEPVLDDDQTYTAASVQDSTLETPLSKTNEDQLTPEGTPAGDEPVDESSLLLDSPSNATGTHSTPRVLGSTKKPLRSPPPSSTRLPTRQRQPQNGPSTPRANASHTTNDSSPFEPPSAFQPPTAQRQQTTDTLLHRVLDKTYRVQATPHRRQPRPKDPTPSTTLARTLAFDSSPAEPPPQLRSDLFSPAPPRSAAPRTPGVPLRSPAVHRHTSTGRLASAARTPALWDSDDDDGGAGDDDDMGISPPKTMQFVVPAARLVATPAREASRRIVADLLSEAGDGGEGEDEDDSGELEAPSPTVVRGLEEDDTF